MNTAKWDGMIALDLFAKRKSYGAFMNVADIGLLFLQYAKDAGMELQTYMEMADKDGEMIEVKDVAKYKPTDKYFGRE